MKEEFEYAGDSTNPADTTISRKHCNCLSGLSSVLIEILHLFLSLLVLITGGY